MSINYESIATDCDIIEQKIEALIEALKFEKAEKAQNVELELRRARNAIQTAKDEAS